MMTKNTLIISILIFLVQLAVLGTALHSAPAESGMPFIQNYSPREYGAHNQNWTIVQDHRGMMYFGNGKGILEYDGNDWRLIVMPNNSTVRSLDIDQNGRIYVGGKGEFGYLAADSIGQLEYISLLEYLEPEDRAFNDVWETLCTPDGIYFRTSHKLFRYQPQYYTFKKDRGQAKIKIWKPQTKFQLAFLVRNTFYIQQKSTGLMRMNGDSLISVLDEKKLDGKAIYIMLPFPGDKILIGTNRNGFYLYDGSLRKFNTELDDFVLQNQIYHAAVLADGTFSLATRRGGVAIMDEHGGFISQIDKTVGLRDNSVWYIYADRQGALWLALNDGLSRVEMPSPLSFFDDRLGLQGIVQDIVRHKGKLYVATSPWGIFYLQSQSEADAQNSAAFFHPIFKPIPGINTQCWSLLSIGPYLLVAANSGVYRIGSTGAVPIKKSVNGSFDSAFLCRSKSDTNRIYVGLFDGAASLKLQNNHWIDEGRIKGIEGEVRSIVETDDRKLWFGTRSRGVYRLDLQQQSAHRIASPVVEHFHLQDGLPSGQIFAFPTRAHTVFTTEDDGIFRFDKQTQRFLPDTTFGKAFADGSRDVEIVDEDQNGNLWLGSEEAGEIDFVRRMADGSYRRQNTACLRITRTAMRSIYSESNGVVWCSTGDGLFRYDSEIHKNTDMDFNVLIRRVVVNGDSLVFGGAEILHGASPPGKQHKISFAHNALRFVFSAPTFDDETENRFRTFLHGFDKGWSPWSAESKKDYTNLSPGSYRFQVRAKNIYQHQSGIASYDFRILSPWYRTWWAFCFYSLLTIVILLTIRRFELKRQLGKIENRRRAKEIEEARKLQLSMLPHQVPQLPNIEIAAFMKTATEVGGDYYDFFVDKKGALTVILGDATGHGLKAGTMVAATKSLLHTLAEDQNGDVLNILKKSNRALKQMNLGALYMALFIMKIKDCRATLCSAGIPPALIYRARENNVEEILLKGMPLGSVFDFPYESKKIILEPGDTIVLLSDGFPERFNKQNKIIGYDKASEILLKAAHKTPQEIIDYFLKVGNEWAGQRPLEDDMTFVVLKMKNGGDAGRESPFRKG